MKNSEKKEFYVYVYFDPRTNPPTPIYIGKGKGRRFKTHLRCSSNFILANKISKIKALGLNPIVLKIDEELSENEAFELEKYAIQKYGRIDLKTGTLCNFSDGGEGPFGHVKSKTELERMRSYRPTEETKRKISLANKGQKRHTPEQMEILRSRNKGKKFSEETLRKLSKIRQGRNEKYNWPSTEILLQRISKTDIGQVAKEIGTNTAMLKDRLRRRGLLEQALTISNKEFTKQRFIEVNKRAAKTREENRKSKAKAYAASKNY